MLPLSHIPLGSMSYALVKVIAVRDVSRTKTDSYFQSIHAADESSEILVTFFNKDPSCFTPLKVHDIIYFLGKFSQSPFGNKLQASVQPGAVVHVVEDVDSLKTMNDLDIQDLKTRYEALANVGHVSKVGRKREFKALKDVERNMFFDFNGLMINKCYGNMAKSCIMIDLVDFTINKELKINTRSEIEGLPLDEPCVFTVTLWDENVDAVSNIPLNSFISLRNVRSKIGNGGVLEGVVHTDRGAFQSAKAVTILSLNHPAVLEIKKRSQKALITKSLTRLLHSGDTFPLYSVSELLNSDKNLKAKIRIRVLDYMPKRLDYFSRPVCSQCEEIYDPSIEGETCNCGFKLTWQFLFSLLVTDETGSIPLIVSDQEAIDFLSNLLPVNLLKDKTSLASLQTLMSSIEESYFECFVKSFKNTDMNIWRFKIFNTVIQKKSSY